MENKNMYQKEYANEMKWDNTTLSLITKYGTLKPPILSVPDDGYFERTWWRLFWAYLMTVIPETRRVH
jgi:hypothetical protein